MLALALALALTLTLTLTQTLTLTLTLALALAQVRFAHLLGQLAVAAAKSGREAAQVRGRVRPG